MAGDEPVAHFALGMASLWSRQLDRAQAEAERCIALSPNSGEFLKLMAHIQIFSGDPAGAIETLKVYMRTGPALYRNRTPISRRSARFARRL